MVKLFNNIKNYVLKIATLILAFFMIPAFVSAALVLDNLQFDPVIVASGDNVDIIIQFHEQITGIDSDKIGNKDYEFQVKLLADDDLTSKYVTITDSLGDDIFGKVYAGQIYNKKFKVKVAQDATPGNYEFKLVGQWYKNGVATGSTQEMRFSMPVKKEGISLTLSNVVSTPNKVRSGDKNVLLSSSLFNSGEKLAKNVVLKFTYPEGISASYTNNNEVLIGVINSFEEKNLQVYIDTEKELKAGVYNIDYVMSYQDVDSNSYEKKGNLNVVIKKKPTIVVLNSSTIGRAGEDIILKVIVKNVGEEKAESVDVRIVKQASQPFEMDVRSAYVGQLNPGEEGVAVFSIKALDDAEIKTHNLNLAIRAKGDSEEGDSSVYTFSDSAKVEITQTAKNNFPMYGLVFLLVLVIGTVVFYTIKTVRNKK